MTATLAVADDADLADIEVLMAKYIPSSTYIMRAMPLQNGKYHALYAAPGLVPDVAKSADGRAYEYNTEQEAEHGAARFLFGVLNTVRRKAQSGKQERYQKLSSAEFAVLLRKADITPSFLAYLAGTTQQRVLNWIDGVDSVPHPIRVMLELFAADQINIDRAQTVTDAVATERRPLRKEAS